MKVEFTQPQAIYLQIGDYRCENILRRLWQGGDRIPSIRELAMDVPAARPRTERSGTLLP